MAESKTYRLERIVDLLRVPLERREQCVKEILLALALADLAHAELLGPTEWTDDGDMSVSLTDQSGATQLALEVTQHD